MASINGIKVQEDPGGACSAASADWPKRIFLIGFMGSGKSTVGLELADRIGYRYIDMDQSIEEDAGMPIREIFIKRGEHHFRNLESRLLDKLCEEDGIIISCGGGIIHDDLNIEMLRQHGPAVYLKGDARQLFDRVKNDQNRPFAYFSIEDEQTRFEKFNDLLTRRQGRYLAAAALTVAIGEKSPREIADEILRKLP